MDKDGHTCVGEKERGFLCEYVVFFRENICHRFCILAIRKEFLTVGN
jgi:hypothetical protein